VEDDLVKDVCLASTILNWISERKDPRIASLVSAIKRRRTRRRKAAAILFEDPPCGIIHEEDFLPPPTH
jgi:hypothetical protein